MRGFPAVVLMVLVGMVGIFLVCGLGSPKSGGTTPESDVDVTDTSECIKAFQDKCPQGPGLEDCKRKALTFCAAGCPSPVCQTGCNVMPGFCCKIPGTNIVAGPSCDAEYICSLVENDASPSCYSTVTGEICSSGAPNCVCYNKVCTIPKNICTQAFTNRCSSCSSDSSECTECYAPFVLDPANKNNTSACTLTRDPTFWSGNWLGSPGKLGNSCVCADSGDHCSSNVPNPRCGCLPGLSRQYVTSHDGDWYAFCAADAATSPGDLWQHLQDAGAVSGCGGAACDEAGAIPLDDTRWYPSVPINSVQWWTRVLGEETDEGNVISFLMPPNSSTSMKRVDPLGNEQVLGPIDYLAAVNTNATSNHQLCNNGGTWNPKNPTIAGLGTVDAAFAINQSECDFTLPPDQPGSCGVELRDCRS